jgi:hypothetical protein
VRRLLAILGAVGMVVGAVAIRQAVDDDDEPGTDGDGEVVLVCATELMDACNALGDGIEVRAELAADTAAAIDGGALADDVDGWITTTAWVEVLESRAPDAVEAVDPLATSATVVATAPGRFEAITDLCGNDDVWACLGSSAGQDWADLGAGSAAWRELKVGLTDPNSALGLTVLASASAGFFGSTTFAANDPAFPEFEGWLATLAEPSADGDEDPARTLATRPGTYSAAGSVAAVAEGFEGRDVRTLAPDNPVLSTVALVVVRGGDDVPGVDAVGDALVDHGWSRPSDDDLAPTLKPGVMAALHTLWRNVTT